MTAIIAITGGLGYLGGRIADCLAATSEVRLLTRDASRRRPSWAERFTIVETDLAKTGTLKLAFEGVDTVVHLAAMNAGDCAKDPEGAHRVNVEGTANVVAAADAMKVRRIVYMSTAHVYAAPLEGFLDETAPTVNAHPYATTHRAAEDIIRAMPGSVVLRLSNGIGSPMDVGADCWMLVANSLCRQAIEKRALTLRGTGFDKRDFIPITEVARAVSHVIGLATPLLGNGIFNLGVGTPMTTRDIAELIAARAAMFLGHTLDLTTAPDDGNRSADLIISMDRLAQTGFTINTDLIPEIDATLEFCRKAFGDA